MENFSENRIRDDRSAIKHRIRLTLSCRLLKIRAHFCQLRFGIFTKTQKPLVNISTGRMKL
ncbi:MAG: hypothetical protein CVV11_19040 [Gammaproteobacteria bacterium HGW-Gammaproteobacteria-15]|nr:MAG: hypothetical protein CVV11_19040 [Gammaproteobacteria bacterium HGW-Gammaproteobacteria-15]